MSIVNTIRQSAKQNVRRVVLPEAKDSRILKAAIEVHRLRIATPILLGSQTELENLAKAQGLNIDGLEIIDANSKFTDEMQEYLLSRKRYASMTKAEIEEALGDTLVQACCLLSMGAVDACVAGAVNTTAEVIRRGLSIVGTEGDGALLSSFMLMEFPESQSLGLPHALFADCAINIDPDSSQLAQIAISTTSNAKNLFGLDPKVAMLSFSTAGTASHPMVEKVKQATKVLQGALPSLKVIGEVQLDAALMPDVQALKLPNAAFPAPANVFIFPDLNAANIGYKIAERFGGARVIGPILQGLNKPLNDLSRGANVDSIVNTIAVTCLQSS